MMLRRLRHAHVACALILAACDSTSDPATTPTDSSTSVDATSDAPSDLGSDDAAPDASDAPPPDASVETSADAESGDVASDAESGDAASDGESGADAAPVDVNLGSIGVTQRPIGGDVLTATTATFHTGVHCVEEDIGACHFSDCDAKDATAASAGTVAISGGVGAPISLVYDATGKQYPPATSTGAAWFAGGESVRVQAPGDTAPAIDRTLVAPPGPRITVTAPTLTTNMPISRTAPLAVTWTGGTTGTAAIVLATYTATRSVSVVCKYEASSGSGSVPVAALSRLLTGSGVLSVDVRATERVDAGGWTLDFAIVQAGIAGTGAATVPVKVE